MSKLLIVNSVLGFGSTGKIVMNIAREYEQKGYEVKVAFGRIMKQAATSSDGKRAALYGNMGVRIGNDMDVYCHGILSRITDKHGLYSRMSTRKFLKWASEYDPDVLWMHNIHGYYINYEMLFDWIKSRPQMKVKWTLHDCWSFTGHCAHFAYVKCDKWKEGCHDCPQRATYPAAIRDNSVGNFRRKKAAFTGVSDMTLITPSEWLKDMVKQSYMSEYPVEVKYNTINTEVFRPVDNSFKRNHGIEDKKMILGVASFWNERKGLDDFIELDKKLRSIDESESTDLASEQNSAHGTEKGNRSKFKIVLVGLSEAQMEDLRKKGSDILGIPRTNSVSEIVEIYSAADVFVNPTYEDTFPTVNMEAEACGTPVITYDTGGCRETLKSDKSMVIPQSVDEIIEALGKMNV
ncbi:glycosyl transferase GT4 family [Butyrivibrio proteoclasticus B316]|uniref:Glycosyl transferase GT4 family n=1 Tax=Butyrivibrio proteoclasticus (strain ATCC 51982 / DSM 14932 / B316) TaxID=515622 RepID=E0RYL9_BUTPB|nr:glycosyltransferase [Butyrivibrio proteoclasticus]ADL33100.1 glycosyl transferase GT4 family [Butyrivibrio proteoclasticus B316]